ncbi:thiol-dependent ubiquitin-specific protease [Aureococcus anophagefferens]|nr:thiol-dependent ubiquitin-specific protease [Aureococcus anophagefferens]
MRRAERDERGAEIVAAHRPLAWVVLFRGDESGDGIHSLSSNGREIVLAFEAADEARRFALVLRAQGFFEPTPHRMEMSALELFCESGERVSLLQIPKGTCIVPPDETVDDVEFTPSARGLLRARAACSASAARRGRQRLELLFR